MLSTDVCVPISKLPEVVLDTKKDLESSGLIKGAHRKSTCVCVHVCVCV